MSGVTLILNDQGRVAGWHDPIKGQCIPAEEVKPSTKEKVAEAAKKAIPAKPKLAAAAVKVESSSWQNILFGKKLPVPGLLVLPGCSSDAKVGEVIEDDGYDFIPPVTEREPNEFGFIETPEGIILPDAVLPATAFDIDGTGGHYQSTPSILLETGILAGKNLQNLNLYVEKGTAPERILFDNDGDDINESTMGCFDGMINMVQLSAEALALTPEERELYGITSCPTAGYESFVVCPDDAANRIQLYLGGYTLENYKWTGETYEKIDEVSATVTDVEELFSDIESGVEFPAICGEAPLPYISVPAEWHSDGTLYLKLKLQLIADARSADANAIYKTYLSVKLKKAEEE